METKSGQYIPGDCNIGSVEIARRRNVGWFGAAITVIVWALFIIFHVAAPWRLFLFLPATFSASGFLQAYLHFCSGFGMQGVFNFGEELYKTTSVEKEEFKEADRKKALQITVYSTSIGVVVALMAFLF
jgi:hypothetical protein